MPHFRAVSSVPTFGWARGGAPGPVEQVPRASNGYYKANVRVCERQPRFSTGPWRQRGQVVSFAPVGSYGDGA